MKAELRDGNWVGWKQPCPSTGLISVRQLMFVDNNVGFVIGNSGILLTHDAGATWSPITTPTP